MRRKLIVRAGVCVKGGAAAEIQHLKDQIADSFALTSSERSDNSD